MKTNSHFEHSDINFKLLEERLHEDTFWDFLVRLHVHILTAKIVEILEVCSSHFSVPELSPLM